MPNCKLSLSALLLERHHFWCLQLLLAACGSAVHGADSPAESDDCPAPGEGIDTQFGGDIDAHVARACEMACDAQSSACGDEAVSAQQCESRCLSLASQYESCKVDLVRFYYCKAKAPLTCDEMDMQAVVCDGYCVNELQAFTDCLDAVDAEQATADAGSD